MPQAWRLNEISIPLRDHLQRAGQQLLNLFDVLRLRGFIEILAQMIDRLARLAVTQMAHAQITTQDDVLRVQLPQACDGADRAPPILAFQIDRPEIVEHPLHDQTERDRIQPERGRLRRFAGRLLHKILAIRQRKDAAAVEGIEQYFVRAIARLDYEMPGQAYARDRQAGSLPDRHRHGGETDRDAHAAFEDLVEITVAWIVVFARIAAKTHLMEQIAAQALDLMGEMPAQVSPDLMCHCSQFVQMRFDIQEVKLVAGQEQRYLGEIQWCTTDRGRGSPARCQI